MKAAPLYRVNLLIERNDTYIYPQQESGNEKEKESPRGARQKKVKDIIDVVIGGVAANPVVVLHQ